MEKKYTEHQCHPELRIFARVKHSETRPSEGCVEPVDLPIIQETVSGSQKLRRFRNEFGMTINNSTSVQDYDVASYNKLCIEKNNSPRNDNEVLPPLCGRLGTLAEPAKYEPCETACRMAEGKMPRCNCE